MLVVIAVIGVTAAIAIPRAEPLAPGVADAVASEIVQAIRFAQREAVRTGRYQYVSVDPATQSLRVYEPNSGANAIHPVDKRPYQISFAGNSMPRATIVSSVFKYDGGPTGNFVSFGPDGAPAYVDPNLLTQSLFSLLLGAKDIDPLKEEGKITIRYGTSERVVRVAPVTGRVSL